MFGVLEIIPDFHSTDSEMISDIICTDTAPEVITLTPKWSDTRENEREVRGYD